MVRVALQQEEARATSPKSQRRRKLGALCLYARLRKRVKT